MELQFKQMNMNMDFKQERHITLKKTDDIVLLSIATFTLFPIYYLLQASTFI